MERLHGPAPLAAAVRREGPSRRHDKSLFALLLQPRSTSILGASCMHACFISFHSSAEAFVLQVCNPSVFRFVCHDASTPAEVPTDERDPAEVPTVFFNPAGTELFKPAGTVRAQHSTQGLCMSCVASGLYAG